MPKYKCFVNDYSHYMAKEIEAKNANEAEEIYMDMVARGDVEIVNSEYSAVSVAKID